VEELIGILSDEDREKIQRIAYRYDQIELRDNLRSYKLLFGVDISHQVVKALKSLSIGHSNDNLPAIEIHRYNPLFNGYHLLMNFTATFKDGNKQNVLIGMTNKNSYFSNQKTLNMYEANKMN